MVRRGPRGAGTALALALALGPTAAAAGVVTSPVVVTPLPNNDDDSAVNLNLIELVGFAFALGPSDSVLTVSNSGGVTEYRLLLLVNNATPADWSAFRIELGTGEGDAFVPVGALSELDFDTPDKSPGPTGGLFAEVEHELGRLRFSQGTVPELFDNAFSFAIDVPDTSDPSGIYSFTLRRVPEAVVAVPMPAALVLLGTTLLGLAALSFRHTCRRMR